MSRRSRHRCNKRRKVEIVRTIYSWIDANQLDTEEQIFGKIGNALVEHEKELLDLGFMEMGRFMEIMGKIDDNKEKET